MLILLRHNWTSQEHQKSPNCFFGAQSKPCEPFKTPTLIIIPANIQNVRAQHGLLMILNRLPPLAWTSWSRDYLYIGMGHYVQTLEPYWALPFWIITRSRENMLLLIWIIMRTHDLIYILIYILMKWLPIDFPHCNIKMFLFIYLFIYFWGWHGIRTWDLLILKQLN